MQILSQKTKLEFEGKYGSGNPLVQKCLAGFVEKLVSILPADEPLEILDVGCGNGELIRRLRDRVRIKSYLGFDITPERVAEARALSPEYSFYCGDALAEDLPSNPRQVILSMEVLEHLEEPELLVRRLTALQSRLVVFSVPHEPFFRLGNLLRLRHLKQWGNHPEHVQQFNPDSLRALVSPYLQDVRIERAFPWVFVAGRTPAHCPATVV